ncbi:hypothetical protein JCM33374_g1603 [Metschnikowia sp. JCM 33374]|nr:hypothetical protein JCM33374_g1603 [Metschnikowia sp. JCM 33374]
MFARRFHFRSPSKLFRPKGYATRTEFERPKGFDINFIPYRPPFFNWKVTLGFAAAGAYLAYSEVIFEKYAQYTEVDESELLPIQLEFKLKTLPIYQKLTKSVDASDWIMMKSYENLDRNVLDQLHGDGPVVDTRKSAKNIVKPEPEYAAQSLTSHTLAQPGGIAIPPVIFHNRKTKETISIVHMGYRLCGYPFVVHGGMLATLLNETFKRNASLRHDSGAKANSPGSLKDDYKVDQLSISYRSPAFADQFFIVKTEQVPDSDPPISENARAANEGGPVAYKSTLESENGKVLVEARAVLRNTGRATHSMSNGKASWSLF